MGVPLNGAKHALYHTGNNSSEAACEWFFSNMEDPKLNEPLKIKKQGAASVGSK